jgi:LmbE family N-acetylglucosaminyl deacetylase
VLRFEDLISQLSYEEAWQALLEEMKGEVKGVFDRIEKVMCVQPHPDDTDVAAGGTVAKLAARGVEVVYVALTDGRLGTHDPAVRPEELAEERRREQEEAARILGVKELVWLGVRDGELQPTLELRWKLVEIIRRFKPDLVMAPDPWLTYEAHPDHRHAGILASEAVLFAPLPHAAPSEGLRPHAVRYVAYYWTRKPNVFVDVSGYVDAKLRAVRSHRTQFGGAQAIEDVLKAYMRLVGKRCGAAYAEAFKVLTPFHFHCNVFAEDL